MSSKFVDFVYSRSMNNLVFIDDIRLNGQILSFNKTIGIMTHANPLQSFWIHIIQTVCSKHHFDDALNRYFRLNCYLIPRKWLFTSFALRKKKQNFWVWVWIKELKCSMLFTHAFTLQHGLSIIGYRLYQLVASGDAIEIRNIVLSSSNWMPLKKREQLNRFNKTNNGFIE